jgi:hypothetical protein
MGEKRNTTGKRLRPRTAPRGKRYLCAQCHQRSPRPVFTPAPWYCPRCMPAPKGIQNAEGIPNTQTRENRS